ncbi:MAG: hypothetical protein JWM14_1217 [Chitinophagaceae bacterium]|nr:hypothetical protein [Chitinophagaceae bacterium]
MIKKAVLFLLFSSLAYSSQAQKVIDKLVKQSCDCFETIDIKESPKFIDSAFAGCLTKVLISNRKELEKHYKMDFSEELMNKILPAFKDELIIKCDRAVQLGMKINELEEEQEETKPAKKEIVIDPQAVVTPQQCLALHVGKFQYIKEGSVDTTKVLEFTKDRILDYDHKGKLITTSTIEWKSDCSYVSTMIKSESEEMKTFAKEKVKLEATIVQIEGDVITYNVKVFGIETLFQLKRIK